MSTGITSRVKLAAMALCLVVVAGCTTQYRNHGYTPSDEDLAQITVGVDTRAMVEEVVGVPSTGGVLKGGDYYYVKSRMRHYAYKRPEVIEREILAISFDSSDRVANIERFGLENGQAVPLSRRVTTTTVQNNGFFRKLLSSIGRFTAGDFVQ